MAKINFKLQDSNNDPGFGYLFPGQGSQIVGMGMQLYEKSSAARTVFHEVDMALGRPLTEIVFNGPEESLRDTVNAQPAIMAVSLAAARAMEEQLGLENMPSPSYIAGHSLGEFTALAIAEVLDVPDAVKLVQERSRLMQDACEQQPGGMAALFGLDLHTVGEIVRETGTYISNVNTSEQVVISGDVIAIAHAIDLAYARGARRAVPLKVSGAFHSALMEPAKNGLMEAVEKLEFHDPTVPIIGNCTGEPLTVADDVKREVIGQISSCVQWKNSIDYMLRSGVSQFIEIGPGKVLASMVKRIDRDASSVSIGDMDSIMSINNQ